LDPSTHKRFLDYVELFRIFGTPDLPKLDQKSFATHDAELLSLLARERSGDLDADGARRIVALRRVLLRD
jgi:hypothetical protein